MSRAIKSSDNYSVTGTSQRSKSLSRFERVHAKTDSGYHVGKMAQDYEIIQRCFRFRPDEIFKRIRISIVVALISESAFLKEDPNSTLVDEKIEMASNKNVESSKQMTVEFDRASDNTRNADCPYLLLDVRDPEQFNKEHIITAKNYPKTKLSRANYEIPEMRFYKNHPKLMIIVYDDDEIVAPQVASTLIQRGYDNIYMLSGGIKVAKHCFPHSLVVPPSGILSVDVSKILVSQLQQMSLRYQK